MIDETQPGYDVTEGVSEQLTVSDTLSEDRLDDFLDEGYNPPDREPSVQVPTESEEERGLSLSELLSAETPDVWVTRPESGSRASVSTWSSVDLPSPLRPTTPIASPSSTPRLTASSSVRVP